MVTPEQAAVVAEVKRRGRKRGERGGWDFLKTYRDEEILELIGDCDTVAGAMQLVGQRMRKHDEFRQELIAHNEAVLEDYNAPDGANQCSIHYYQASCDCPEGT